VAFASTGCVGTGSGSVSLGVGGVSSFCSALGGFARGKSEGISGVAGSSGASDSYAGGGVSAV
jgi:hypothetical protein